MCARLSACHAASSFIRDAEGRGISLLAMSDDVRVERPVLSSVPWLSLSPLYGTTLPGVTRSSVHPALLPLATCKTKLKFMVDIITLGIIRQPEPDIIANYTLLLCCQWSA